MFRGKKKAGSSLLVRNGGEKMIKVQKGIQSGQTCKTTGKPGALLPHVGFMST